MTKTQNGVNQLAHQVDTTGLFDSYLTASLDPSLPVKSAQCCYSCRETAIHSMKVEREARETPLSEGSHGDN